MQAPPWLLEGLELSALVRRAQAAGVDGETMRAASNAEDAKKAFVALLMLRDVVRTELVEMPLKDLRRRAVSARLDNQAMDQALSAVFAKEALVNLILAKEAPWGWAPTVEHVLPITPDKSERKVSHLGKVAASPTGSFAPAGPVYRGFAKCGRKRVVIGTFETEVEAQDAVTKAESEFAIAQGSHDQGNCEGCNGRRGSTSHAIVKAVKKAEEAMATPRGGLSTLMTKTTMDTITDTTPHSGFSDSSSDSSEDWTSNEKTPKVRESPVESSGNKFSIYLSNNQKADASSGHGDCLANPSGASAPLAHALMLSPPSRPTSPFHGSPGRRRNSLLIAKALAPNPPSRRGSITQPEDLQQSMPAILLAAAVAVSEVKQIKLKEHPELPPRIRGAALRSLHRTWRAKGGEVLEPMLTVIPGLGHSAVRLVDARFIIELADWGGRFCRREDLPEAAFIDFQTLKSMPGGGLNGECLRIVAISHPWLQSDHPDPYGFNLKILARVLQSLINHSGGTYAVFLDFMSLFQDGTNDAEFIAREKMLFNRGLSNVMEWFAHPHIMTFKLTGLPDGCADSFISPSGAKPNLAAYLDRGWCFGESSVSDLAKDSSHVLDLGNLSGNTTNYKHIIRECTSKRNRPPPLSPANFRLEVAKKRFTYRETDEDKVVTLYHAVFQSRLTRADFLHYSSRGWGEADAEQLGELISSGCTPGLKMLCLGSNEIRDAGCMALAEAFCSGVLPHLETLYLGNNQISNDGCSALAEAFEDGALPNLIGISLKCNRIGDFGLIDLAEACTQGALSCLKDLQLANNVIGDVGCTALADACADGALPNLTFLNLENNVIGDLPRLSAHDVFRAREINRAVPALIRAFGGSMQHLRYLKIDNNNFDRQQIAKIHVRILDVLQDIRNQKDESDKRVSAERDPDRSAGSYNLSLAL